MENKRFFYCEICGNIIGKIHDTGVPVFCCGKPMTAFNIQTEDGPYEKHLPVVKVQGNTVDVRVGSVLHPMTPEHNIRWIYLQTEKGGQRKNLKITDAPQAKFMVVDDKPVGVFEYCNLHGLWYTEIK